MAKLTKMMDGNEAAGYISYAFTEVAGIYPITPSSNMAEHVDEWSANGKKNIFGQTVNVIEMQSEAGAAGTMHGSLAAGALTTSYTASQGLLLMIPNMFKMAGELLPGVLHVSARAVASHALSIFGDHSDVMACRQTGFAMLASSNPQQVMDLGAVSHMSAIKGRVPFLHFFDGFRTSHEIQKIKTLDYEDLAKIVDWDAIKTFRGNALNPEHPVLRGTAQNPDIFFQAREACNPFYTAIPAVVEYYMGEINKLTGSDYKLFNYYGAKDAENIIIAMGSSCDCIEETVDYLNANGSKVGMINVHLYRPFSIEHFMKAIPDSVKKIAVLDRTKEPGSLGEPLYQDILTAYIESGRPMPKIVAGRYGLGSKDTTPAQIIAVYENLKKDDPKNHFTVGIIDDVTNLSLPVSGYVDVTSQKIKSCKFWGIGSDGTVSANKNSIKIIGDHTDMHAQAYFAYDSKKSGGNTQSHLRFGTVPIKATYLVKSADFIACHNESYVDKYDMVSDLKEGGTFLLNCLWSDDELNEKLPNSMKRLLAQKKAKMFIINATDLAKEIGLKPINTILQAAFFKLTDIIPYDDAVNYMKKAIVDSYGRKGEKVVNMNYAAVDAGITRLREFIIPADWAALADEKPHKVSADCPSKKVLVDFVNNVAVPVNAQKGESLPVSAFKGREDGTFPQGTAAFEKRGIAVDVPHWKPENCIQCNRCSYVCPHAAIRPFLLTDEEKAKAPACYETLKGMKGYDQYQYRMQVSPYDCYGCGACVLDCPAKEKALVMEPFESQISESECWKFSIELKHKANPLKPDTVKGSQFEMPLLEFSGACAGCGETPYAKLITQLYGDRMYIANATGCSSIWGGSAPSTPFCLNERGQGPTWANSLFEDNAEYGYGFQLAVKQRRNKLKEIVIKLAEMESPAEWGLKAASEDWLANMNDGNGSKAASDALRIAIDKAIADCGSCGCEADAWYKHVKENDDMLVKKSVWIFGGDGWAYDIGFGGLDHVIAMGDDVNILIFDTEVYSNTGGQSSKASPTASVAKFAASGKKVRKKDLGLMAMSYGYVYVTQIAMGANQAQTLKAITEAEAYPGPSVIIAYAPCISHGIRAGMGAAQQQTKRAVDSGYWHLYRYNPLLADEGKNPFVLESKDPTASFGEFINSEVRYTSLKQTFPEVADELFAAAEEDAKKRLAAYKRMAAEV